MHLWRGPLPQRISCSERPAYLLPCPASHIQHIIAAPSYWDCNSATRAKIRRPDAPQSPTAGRICWRHLHRAARYPSRQVAQVAICAVALNLYLEPKLRQHVCHHRPDVQVQRSRSRVPQHAIAQDSITQSIRNAH